MGEIWSERKESGVLPPVRAVIARTRIDPVPEGQEIEQDEAEHGQDDDEDAGVHDVLLRAASR